MALTTVEYDRAFRPFQQLMVACQAHRPALLIKQHHPWTMAPWLTHSKCQVLYPSEALEWLSVLRIVRLPFLIADSCFIDLVMSGLDKDAGKGR